MLAHAASFWLVDAERAQHHTNTAARPRAALTGTKHGKTPHDECEGTGIDGTGPIALRDHLDVGQPRLQFQRRPVATGGGGEGAGGGTPLHRPHEKRQLRETLSFVHLPRETLLAHLLALFKSMQLTDPGEPSAVQGWRSLPQPASPKEGEHVPSPALKHPGLMKS